MRRRASSTAAERVVAGRATAGRRARRGSTTRSQHDEARTRRRHGAAAPQSRSPSTVDGRERREAPARRGGRRSGAEAGAGRRSTGRAPPRRRAPRAGAPWRITVQASAVSPSSSSSPGMGGRPSWRAQRHAACGRSRRRRRRSSAHRGRGVVRARAIDGLELGPAARAMRAGLVPAVSVRMGGASPGGVTDLSAVPRQQHCAVSRTGPRPGR